MPSTNIIIQARTSSTRLPGKVLKRLAGKEVLWHVIDRCRRAKAKTVIVATSTRDDDTQIAKHCQQWQVPVVRGDIDDVLSRFVLAANYHPAESYIRITADCPLVDPAVIDLVGAALGGADYASNVLERTIPHGLDVEAFTHQALMRAAREADSHRYREHVTLIMRENPSNTFTTTSVPMPTALQRPDLRLTLDTLEDYRLMSAIYDALYHGSPIAIQDAYTWLDEHPDVKHINKDVKQKTLSE